MGPLEKMRQYFGHSNQIISHKKSIAQAQRVGDHEALPLFIGVTLPLIKSGDVVKILSFSETNQMLGNRQTSNPI